MSDAWIIRLENLLDDERAIPKSIRGFQETDPPRSCISKENQRTTHDNGDDDEQQCLSDRHFKRRTEDEPPTGTRSSVFRPNEENNTEQRHQQNPYGSSWEPGHTKRRITDHSGHRNGHRFRFPLPPELEEIVSQSERSDRNSLFLFNGAKKGLMNGSLVTPFKGNPISFWGWYRDLCGIMPAANLSTRDILRVFRRNCEGEPRKFIEEVINTDDDDPVNSIRFVWNHLVTCYGDKLQIITDLYKRIEETPVIRGSSKPELKRIMDLAQNLTSLARLTANTPSRNKFLFADGITTVLGKMPPMFIESWKQRLATTLEESGRNLDFEDLVDMIFKYYHRESNPLAMVTQVTTKIVQAHQPRVLATEVKSNPNTVEPATDPADDGCIIHLQNNHLTTSCETFLQLPPEEKRQRMRRHGCCFRCVRKGHLARECKAEVSCETCQRRHHTAVHSVYLQQFGNAMNYYGQKPNSTPPETQ